MHQPRYVTNRSINRMGFNINKKIEILSDIKTRKDETEYIKHRLVLKYDNGCISAEVINMIIKDFYPNYNKDGNKIFLKD